MRYKAYHTNIGQDNYPRPFRFIDEDDNFEALQDRVKESHPDRYFYYIDFYDMKHELKIRLSEPYKIDKQYYISSQPINDMEVT